MAVFLYDDEEGVALEFDDLGRLKEWLDAQPTRFEPSQCETEMDALLGRISREGDQLLNALHERLVGRDVPGVDIGDLSRRPRRRHVVVQEVIPELPESK